MKEYIYIFSFENLNLFLELLFIKFLASDVLILILIRPIAQVCKTIDACVQHF